MPPQAHRPSHLLDAMATAWGVLAGQPPGGPPAASSRPCIQISPAPTAADTMAAERHSPYQSRGLRVLIAEDNPVNQRLAQVLLGKLGCRVDIANDGREAVQRVAQCSYDLIFMDCYMPIMDVSKPQPCCGRAKPMAATFPSSPSRPMPW